MIVVTGATGRVGGLVARQLVRLGVPFRMAVTDATRAPAVDAEVVVAPYEDADALAKALDPGDRVFMVSMFAAPEQRLALHRSFVEAAAARRVGRIVYLSFVGASEDAGFRHARSHGATEALLAAAGIPTTFVRNAMYADEIPAWFDARGVITGPGGDGRVSYSYRPELAEAIAVLLADPARDDRSVVTVTTPDTVTLTELAELASEATGGGDYRYEPAERGAWIAYRRSLLRPEWSIEAGLSYYDGVAAGDAEVVGTDYERLTGTPPLTIRELVTRHRSELPPVPRRGA